MRTSSALVIVILVLTFPLWFGLGIGFFGLIVGLLGGLVGLVFGLIGGLFGAIAWAVKGFFSMLFGWSHHDAFDMDFSFFDFNGWAVAAIILFIVLLTRSKKSA
jgi:hypothetical protein